MSKTALKHTTGMIAIILNLLFWGIASPIIKVGLNQVPPEVFLFYRFFIVIVISTPFLFLFRKSFSSLKPSHLIHLLTIGLLTNPLTLGLLFVGLSYTTSLASVIISSSTPIFIMVGSVLFLKEKITMREVVGVLIASIGTLLVIFETPVQEHASNPLLGNFLTFLSNIVWTVGVLFMKKLARTYHPFLFGYTGWLTGMIVFLGYAVITKSRYILAPLAMTQLPEAYWSILYMAIFGSLVAFTAYQVAQQYLPASEVSIFSYLLPLVTIPLSIFWLHEKIEIFFILGSTLLALGVIIAEFHPSSRLKRILQRNIGKRGSVKHHL